MYKINIRGLDPLFVEDGAELLKQFTEDKLPDRVSIGGAAFISSDIRSVIEIDEPKSTQVDHHVNDQADYMDFRRRMLRLSLDERANILRIPKMVWFAHHKTELPDGIKPELVRRQRAFFEEHPNCIFANPKVYRDLVECPMEEKMRDKTNPIGKYVGLSVLRYIENVCRTDYQISLLSTDTSLTA